MVNDRDSTYTKYDSKAHKEQQLKLKFMMNDHLNDTSVFDSLTVLDNTELGEHTAEFFAGQRELKSSLISSAKSEIDSMYSHSKRNAFERKSGSIIYQDKDLASKVDDLNATYQPSLAKRNFSF